MGRKALYESIQLLEHKIQMQNTYIEGLSTNYTTNKINPAIKNNFNYNLVLSSADKIQACSRYITDIPELNLPSNKLEALFYDNGALCFSLDHGYPIVTSFAKTGSLNGLGDLKEIIPIDFAGNVHTTHRTVVYDRNLTLNPCVIIQDYTGSYKEDCIYPRAALNNVSINDQAAVYRQLKNVIKLTAKKAIALIEDEGSRASAEKNLSNIIDNDNPIISLIGSHINQTMSLFNIDTKVDFEGYIRAIEAFSRPRTNFNGIPSRSPMDKKERQITSEVENDSALTDIYLYDGLINRQIGIELMKIHRIISEGSCKINPLLAKKSDNSKVEKKESKEIG